MVGKQFYVARTYPCREAYVSDTISKMGFENFYPYVVGTQRVKHRGKVTWLEPVFPEYVFVNVDLWNDVWEPITQVRGVIGILGSCDGDPIPVSNEIIEIIRGEYATGGYQRYLHPERLPHGIKAGDALRIADPLDEGTLPHPFAGHTGTCVYTHKDQVRLELSVFGRFTVVRLDRAQVVPVSPKQLPSLRAHEARV